MDLENGDMALSIKTERADELARQLAAATHESLTEAVTTALRERLTRVRSRQGADIVWRLNRLADQYAALPVRDVRSAEEIIGYDDAGRAGVSDMEAEPAPQSSGTDADSVRR